MRSAAGTNKSGGLIFGGRIIGEFADIWIEQCDATREIREAWGTRKALGYPIGEKLLNHIRASDSDPSWAATLPLFANETWGSSQPKSSLCISPRPRESDRPTSLARV